MRCSNRKLLIVFEGSAQRERTIEHDIIITYYDAVHPSTSVYDEE